MTAPSSPGQAGSGRTVIATLTNGSVWTRSLRHKLPEVTPTFWIALVLSVRVVGAAEEYLSVDLGLGLSATTAIVSLCFAGALLWQLSTAGYVRGVYWLTLILASAVGAALSENMVEDLGLSPGGATTLFCAALTLCFLGWYRGEHTVSIHTVYTRRREAWYWTAILCTFALGSSVDAILAEVPALGHATVVLLCGGVLAAIAVAHLGFKTNALLAFWAASVMTRPFGASLGGLLAASPGAGGLGLGANATSTIFLAVLIVGGCTAVARRAARRPHDTVT